MYKTGTKLYIAQGTSINLRTSPEIREDNKKIIGTMGDPAKGKFIGTFKSTKTAGGITWVELDYPKFKWIDSRLVTDQMERPGASDQVFSMPGITANVFLSVQDQKPLLKFTGYTMVGTINSTVDTANGRLLKIAAKGYTGSFLYVRQDQVITGSQIKDRIRQAIINDNTLFKSVLAIQSRLIEDQEKGLDTTKAQELVNQYMNRFAQRQKMWKDFQAKGELNLDNSFSGNLQTIYNRVRSHFGVGAINWLAVGLIAAVVFTIGSVVSVAVYKSWFESKPTTSSAFDLNKMEQFRTRYEAAKTDSEKKAAMDWLNGTINKYGEDEFDRGEESGKKDGFLSNLGNGIGKAIIAGGLLAIAGYYINKNT
jgi:hypothetical protein